MTNQRSTQHATRNTQHVKRKTQLATCLLPLASCLLLLALLPRLLGLGAFISADEDTLLNLSSDFLTAVLRGRFADTIGIGYPAVTIRGLGALGLAGRYGLYRAGLSPLPGGESPGTIFQFLDLRGQYPLYFVTAGRLPLALTAALCVVGMYLLLRRLLGGRRALLAAALIALDPYYLAHSRLLHVDGLLTSFMALFVLAYLVYLREGGWRWLALSGVLLGLAGLTKSPAAFLVPWAALAAGWHGWATRWSKAEAVRWGRDYVLMGVAAGAVFVALWPVMWVDPVGGVMKVVTVATGLGSSPHYLGGFFLGRLVKDPGGLYYPVVFLFETTPVSLIGLGLAGWALARGKPLRRFGSGSPSQPSQGWRRAGRASLWALLVFAVLYGAFMALGAKKADRYILPVFPLVDVLAAVGWVWLAGQVRWPHWAEGRRVVAVGVAVAVLQAAISLPHYPYYLTHYNLLAGGPWTAPWALLIGRGEGLDRAARYLDRQPDAAESTVATWYTWQFRSFYRGQTVSYYQSVEPALWADHTVMYINQVQRGQPDPDLVRYFRHRRPEYTVRLKGLDYAWVYPGPIAGFDPPAPRVGHRLDADFGPVRLLGLDAAGPVSSGATRHVTLYWQCLAAPPEDYNVYLRLVDETGHVWGRVDRWPVGGFLPTGKWLPGLFVTDEYDLPVPPGTPPGDYRLAVGLYAAATGQVVGQAETGPVVRVIRPATPPAPDALAIPHRSGARFGELTLLGHDFDGGPAQPGQRVGFTLYWRATAAVEGDYRVVVRLVDAGGQARREWHERPAGGRYPTPGWQQGEVVADWHEITVPANVPSGDYALRVSLADAGGRPAGPEVALGTLTVESRPRTFAVPPIPHPQPANFDNQIALLGYDLEARTRNTQHATRNTQYGIRLTLYWQTLTEMHTSYTVFVHVLDAGGRIVAQRDSVPGGGALPTTGWVAGEVIADEYELAVDAPGGEYRIEVGLYDAASGQRLPTVDEAGQAVGDRVLLDGYLRDGVWSTQ